MHPQLYLKTFWRMELKPTIFVAMSFSDRYNTRFKEVIEPAITSISVQGIALKADRVDVSKSGDSILTDIMDGIAHSQMVLADVSSVGKDSVTGEPFRNGNVMYEVGLALACRHSSEVLLIRDDNDRFLFDVSTIPHKKIDFTDPKKAVNELHKELSERLNERKHINDARVKLAIAGLSSEETSVLKYIADLPPGNVLGPAKREGVDFQSMVSIPRLLDKQLIVYVGEFEKGNTAYEPTPLGHVVAKLVKSGLVKIKANIKDTEQQESK